MLTIVMHEHAVEIVKKQQNKTQFFFFLLMNFFRMYVLHLEMRECHITVAIGVSFLEKSKVSFNDLRVWTTFRLS